MASASLSSACHIAAQLNVLANFMGKPVRCDLSEFQGNAANPEHVRARATSNTISAPRATARSAAAPSICHWPPTRRISKRSIRSCSGKVRAEAASARRCRAQPGGRHPDAWRRSLRRPGTRRESLELADLRGFRTGGTVHIIVNNQIGFTTSPSFAFEPLPVRCREGGSGTRSFRQWRRPQAVIEGGAPQIEYRQRFKKDVVIDLFCHRRHGHNNRRRAGLHAASDVPRHRPPPDDRQLYAQRLVAAGAMSDVEVEAMASGFIADLEAQLPAAESYRPNKRPTGWKARGPGLKRRRTMTPPQRRCAAGRVVARGRT
jgi:2-oxoglutarate dehydrogenase E1 component